MAKWEEGRPVNRRETPAVAVPKTEIVRQKETPVIYSELPYKEDMFRNMAVLRSNLENCLHIIDDEVMKGYVTRLDQMPVVAMAENEDMLRDVQLFRITELVYQENELSVHKLSTVFHSLANRPCTLVLMIRSDGDKSEFFLGVRSLNPSYSSGRMRDMLERSLEGMFPGSRIERYWNEYMKRDMEEILKGSLTSVTSIADYKQAGDSVKDRDYIQGLEKFVDSMRGKTYTAIFLADSVSYDELNLIKADYENICTQISPFASMQINFTSNTGTSNSDGKSTGQTDTTSHAATTGETSTHSQAKTKGETENHGTTDTTGTNDSVSDGSTETTGVSKGISQSESFSHTDGTTNTFGINGGVNGGVSAGGNLSIAPFGIGGGANASGNVGAYAGTSYSHGVTSSDTKTKTYGTSRTESTSTSISKTLTHGISDSHAESKSRGSSQSDTESYGTSRQASDTYSTGETFSFVDTKTLTDSFGTSQGITMNAQNMMLSSALKRLEKQLNRIDECESVGMWRFAAYFLGESAAETETAANTYHSIVSGTQSGVERSAINTWGSENPNLPALADYVTSFCHPRFIYHGFSYDGSREVIVNPSVLVSTNELAIHMGLPRHSVKGLPVVEHAVFAQEVLRRNERESDSINIGHVYHLGEETSTAVELDLKSLTMHTFVTGSTGAGKSNAVYYILNQLKKKEIPFLVVEPAKGEYKRVFPDVNCFGTNPNIGRILRINPFSFPKEVHVLEHIDRLIEIFNVCWPMYAAMPAVLKDSVERAYASVGWDMDLSVNRKVNGLFPTFEDVLQELNNTINSSAYSADTKSDYIGSLSTRVRSLTNGINGRIFVSQEMDMGLLFDQNAILDISRVGSMETKALIMGLVVLKLQEYRMSCANEMNADLMHVTVLEEAHNLLKKTSTQQSEESANLQGKSVEMLTNMIAEIRTYGEGFVIVDQAPNLLDTAAIRNTNTKIVMRLPEYGDREITGKSMGLKDSQISEISKLPTGVAVVYQNDWQDALLCKMPFSSPDSNVQMQRQDGRETQYWRTKQFQDDLLRRLLLSEGSQLDKEQLRKDIFISNVASRIKKDLIINLDSHNLAYEWAVAEYIDKNYDYFSVFKGTTNTWNSYEELLEIAVRNVETQFEGFSRSEAFRILYYVCTIYEKQAYENQSKLNANIEILKTRYLRKEMM